MLVWLNGTLVEREDAQVSAFDAGFTHAIGLFETMAARHGVVFRVQAHMDRLVESAKMLLLSESLRPGPLAEATKLAVERNGLESARVRLTVTGGNLNVLASPQPQRIDPTILIDVQPPTGYPDAFFERGVMVTLCEDRANPFSITAGHKTLAYWPRIRALQHAAAVRAAETLWFSVHNHLVGGSVSNAFVVRDDRLETPIARGEEHADAIRSAVLPGITRGAIMELAREAGIETTTRLITITELLEADELFLTNSSWGVLPVITVEKETIGTGAVGPVTARLREAWLDLMERETRRDDVAK